MEKGKYHIVYYGKTIAWFNNGPNAVDFVRQSRANDFMITLWEQDGKHLRPILLEV
jgi:hypothetical protein